MRRYVCGSSSRPFVSMCLVLIGLFRELSVGRELGCVDLRDLWSGVGHAVE